MWKCKKGEKQYKVCKELNADYCSDCPHGIKENSIEEDIKIVKEIKKEFITKMKKDITHNDNQIRYRNIQALQNILNELDRLQKENEELKEKRIDSKEYGSMKIRLANSIPKSVIEDKIDVLEKIQKEFKNNEELRIKIITYKELLNKGE